MADEKDQEQVVMPEAGDQEHKPLGDTSPEQTPPKKAAQKKAALPAKPDPKRMVKIRLSLNKKEKGIFVSVNNHRYFIPRGEVVEVPAYIAEIIENSQKQDEETIRYIEGLGANSNF
jgi:hypothetical protein